MKFRAIVRKATLPILISSPLFAGQDYTIDRQGSRLTIEWESDGPGHWSITGEGDNLCAFGEIKSGFNRIQIPKIANSDDLVFKEEIDRNGRVLFAQAEIKGKPVLSNLRKPDRNAIIYQISPRTFLATGIGEHNSGKLAALTDNLLAKIKELGVDYVWMTGVLEHANRKVVDPDVVKGDAGSYYAIYDSWDVSSQIGSLDDFDDFIQRAHKAGLRVLIDFVANHTARIHNTDVKCKQSINFGKGDRTDELFNPANNYYYVDSQSAFEPPHQPHASDVDGVFDSDLGTAGIQLELPAKVTGNNVIDASPSLNDWYETVRLNYGYDIYAHHGHYQPTPRTWTQMVDVAKYWLNKGVDGFRVDFAHAVPIEFWRYFARELRQLQPNTFLLAEAYEEDSMILPGFSYQAMFHAGFDSVYNAKMYWNIRRQAQGSADVRTHTFATTPAVREDILQNGFSFTNYVENHDEVRLSSRHFSEEVSSREERAQIGFAYSVFSSLLPGHFLIQAGQELQEDAGIFGNFAGDNGRTSIFDFVYQQYSHLWVTGNVPTWMEQFRTNYKDLLSLKLRAPFRSIHSRAAPSFIELTNIDGSEFTRWIGSYLRFSSEETYLVVFNADPKRTHEAAIHFTSRDGEDSHGALQAMKISNDDRRYLFVEDLTRKGWMPRDPNIDGNGIPGKVLYKSGNVPSGLYLGSIPAGTAYVFKVVPFD